MNRFLFLSSFIILTFFLSFQLFGQTTESVSVNGEKYFVYPHKLKLSPHPDYKYALKKKNFKKIFYEFDAQKQSFDKEELKELKSDIRKDKRRHSQFFSIHHKGYKYKKAIRKNYVYFFQPDYSLEEDIVPSLDSLPDGKYVQYFEDFIIGDLDGNIIIEKNKIAGIFSIKNNLLEGKAIWLDIQGDTLKQGTFHNGVKEGKWALRNYIFYDEHISSYERIGLINNQLQPDTLEWNAMYSNGLKNGTYHYSKKQKSYITINDGHYTNDQETGTWINKATRMINSYTYSDRNDIVVLQKYTYNSSDSISHQYLIRNKIVNQFPFRVKNYDFRSNIFTLHPRNLIFYKINFPIPEKGKNQYNESFHNNTYNTVYKALNNDYFYNYENTRSSYAELTEQFGKRYLFEGEYESYYPNGQLMFHFNFKNNQLEKEDTLFWDNGNTQDVISPIIDSNQFTRSIFDYTGTLYIQNLYDAKGNFVRTIFDGGASKQLFIENLPVEYDSPYFRYQAKLDSNLIVQSDTFLVSKSWHKFDTTLYETTIYVPKERKLTQRNYSISGKIIKQSETQFSTQFTTATHTILDYYGDFCTIEQRELEFFESDFINLIREIKHTDYQIISYSEKKLLKNKIPYSGAIELSDHLFVRSHSEVGNTTLKIPHQSINKLIRLHKKQKRTTKQRDKFTILDYTSCDKYDVDERLESIFFDFFLVKSIPYVEDPHYEGKITFINGVANGQWILNHTKWKESLTINFKNNSLHGPVLIYAGHGKQYSDPNDISRHAIIMQNYVNDTLNGLSIDKMDKIYEQATYLNGEKNGIEIKNLDNTYFSLKQYKNGIGHGNYSVFILNKNLDTSYVLKANFENNELVGKAVKYSPNGKIEFLYENNILKEFDTMQIVLSEITYLNGSITSEKIFDHGLLDTEYQFDSKDSLHYYPSTFYHDANLLRIKNLVTAKKKNSKRYSNHQYDELYYNYDDDFESETENYSENDKAMKSQVSRRFQNYTIIKYYGNGKIARKGELFGSDKVGNWKHYSYEGRLLYEINYADTTITLNDSISFQNFGTFILYDSLGTKISESYIIENLEKYDCSNNDHYTIRQFYTIWEKEGANRINGYVKNYYDNGVLQSEGLMKNGLPEGVWKYYDPFGKLNQLGKYTLGLKEGRWITGDLGKIKYLGDICFDPNIPNIEKLIKERETELDIKISIFVHGKSLNNSFYEINKFGSNSSSGSNDYEENPSDINLRVY